jgi:uncharacterized membrane protein YqhA
MKPFRVRWVAFPTVAIVALSLLAYGLLKMAIVNTQISLKYEETSATEITQQLNRLLAVTSHVLVVLKLSAVVLCGLLIYRWFISPSQHT